MKTPFTKAPLFAAVATSLLSAAALADDAIKATTSGGSVSITFIPSNDQFYQFQSSSDLVEWNNMDLFVSDGADYMHFISAPSGRKFFRHSKLAGCLRAEWQGENANNQFRINVEWNDAQQRFEGILTLNGIASGDVGFSIGELVWTATIRVNLAP